MSDSGRPRIVVLGAGAWGTALAAALARNPVDVVLWGRDRDAIERMEKARENARYLPGQPLPERIELSHDLTAATGEATALVFSTPSHTFRELLRAVAPRCPFLWSCKGVEPDSLRLMHEVVAEELAEPPPHGTISGPSFAREVMAGMPTALTVASADADFAARAVGWFHGKTMRAYTNPDVTGVEVGAALKNVLAIACGVADGLGFGANARAAVITRGLAELMRLGERMGGRRETFMGLAGLGDLVLTCTDDQSRNRRFGLALARGLSVDEACAEIGQAVEGLRTTRAAAALARRHGVDMPIVDQVHAVLYQGRDARTAVQALLERDPKQEIPHPQA
ncbi:MAG: NAD(P)H-dependent glycerol-3-phosphate dehydrogenase [Halofilum sp. (in: g-proteobacteria)]|nr:NAD(P)H-dependent glycerol-3-phosphate dehydrogenase [Halofilum sp. (in: g-proteobacteria)]